MLALSLVSPHEALDAICHLAVDHQFSDASPSRVQNRLAGNKSCEKICQVDGKLNLVDGECEWGKGLVCVEEAGGMCRNTSESSNESANRHRRRATV